MRYVPELDCMEPRVLPGMLETMGLMSLFLGLLAQHPQWERQRVDHRRPVHEDLVHGGGHLIPRVFRHVEVRCAVTILAELDRVDGVAAQSTHRAPFAT